VAAACAAGDHDAARDLLRAALLSHAPSARYWLAVRDAAATVQGADELARSAARRALEINPESPAARRALGLDVVSPRPALERVASFMGRARG
jgi:hypothetical protein